MAWTDVSAASVWWQIEGFCNEFVDAIAERAAIVGVSNMATIDAARFPVAVDDHVQSYMIWSQLQQWCLDNCDEFVRSKDWDDPDYVEADYDNSATIDMWTSTLLGQYITGSPSNEGFRRYTTHPDDGGTVAYGNMEIDDIIDIWIFQDLQKALNVLTWTKYDLIDVGTPPGG